MSMKLRSYRSIRIAGLQRVSLIDYPKHIAASVFLAGCNLRCPYCHNRWMCDATDVEEAIAVQSFLAWLETREGLLDGVCVSGGEPTIQSDLPPFLCEIRERGFGVKLDTNGTRPEMLDRLLEEDLLDYVAMDVKAPLDERYYRMAGRPIELSTIRTSMALLRSKAPTYEFRTTVAPGLGTEELVAIASELEDGDAWIIQPFRYTKGVDAALADAEALDEDALVPIVEKLQQRLPGVGMRK
jgi:pyruvate formate lyase activating enzyme